MTLKDAQGFVFGRDIQLLGLLAKYRLAVYRGYLTALLPYATQQEKQAANDAQARADLAVNAASNSLYDLLTKGAAFEILDSITPEDVVRRLAELPPVNDTRQLDENGEAR